MSSSLRRVAPLVLKPTGQHTATVIWCHGLGDTANGWVDALEQIRDSKRRLDEVKFILPTAPTIPITVNRGFQMPGWFDIKSLSNSDLLSAKATDEDAEGIKVTRSYLNSLIQEEISAGIPSDRIVLGGFSQGGAMSIFSGLTSTVKLAGVVALSSWLLLHKAFREHVPEGDINKSTPVLMCHGTADPVVQFPIGQESEKALKEMGYDITFKSYRGMQHSACIEELIEVEQFLHSRLPPKGKDEL